MKKKFYDSRNFAPRLCDYVWKGKKISFSSVWVWFFVKKRLVKGLVWMYITEVLYAW